MCFLYAYNIIFSQHCIKERKKCLAHWLLHAMTMILRHCSQLALSYFHTTLHFILTSLKHENVEEDDERRWEELEAFPGGGSGTKASQFYQQAQYAGVGSQMHNGSSVSRKKKSRKQGAQIISQ
jgi:hypothetical protein